MCLQGNTLENLTVGVSFVYQKIKEIKCNYFYFTKQVSIDSFYIEHIFIGCL